MALAFAACCKDKPEETTEPTPTAEATTAAAPEAAAPLETNDPEWKTKCPDADRPEGGTVTTLRNLQIFEKPDSTSKKLSNIIPGTWVNLLGAKGTWYCIDYPCDVGKLCPGWIEARYSKRKEPEPDAGKPDAGKDAGKDAEVKDAGREGGIRIPLIRLKDGGTTGGGTGGGTTGGGTGGGTTGTGGGARTPPGPGRPPGPGAIPLPK